jgi:hypothetical protein
MSRSRANELLQKLVRDLQNLWNGNGAEITATEAYKICEEIAKESKEDEQ